ncbi:UDP-3-O-(3-hydroxymyristoyl)glucosamine N-acyltransferase [Candidatus Fermentibacteria bacterium]|nr:UDP-3-O-(3-hydroxymyristoyl)glucosamine N-acyltransferase [Candidatus Fermentibacteria bacterium]
MARTDPLTLAELAERLGGRLIGKQGDRAVEGVSTLADAGPSEVCYYGNPKYHDQLSSTSALAVIVTEEVETSSPNQIVVDSAYAGFREALMLFRPPDASGFGGVHRLALVHDSALVGENVSIGPFAVVDRDVEIGEGSRIGPCCYLGPEVKVGRECELHSGVRLEARTEVGNRVRIHSGSVLGSDGFGFVPDPEGAHRKVPQNGNVLVGDHVEIGANCAIDRGVTGSTMIGEHTKLDNLVQVAHNVILGRGCLLAAQTGIAGSTRVGDGVVFGGQAGIVGHVRIGDGARIGAQAGVTKDVPAGETYSGYPARPHREALLRDALVSRLPRLFERLSAYLSDRTERKDDE